MQQVSSRRWRTHTRTSSGSLVQGIAAETFLILPHAQVAQYILKKASEYDRWIGGMAKLRRSMLSSMHRFVTRDP